MSNIRLGIIGCGIMGERILRVALDNQDLGVTLGGVFEPSGKRRAELAETFPGIHLPDTRDALLADSDCIYIASPPLTHLEHARAAIAADCSVLTEKPLAVSIADSESFHALAQQPGSRVAVNFIFASSPAAQQVASWIRDGFIGEPESLNIGAAFAKWPREWQEGASSWLSGPDEGGFTREVLSHFLFLTCRVFGDMTLKTAALRYDKPSLSESSIDASVIAGGLPVEVRGSVGDTEETDHNVWEVTGSKGRLRLRDWSYAERWDPASQSWQGDPNAIPHAEMRPVILRGQVGKLPALTGDEPQDLATVGEALQVQRIVEGILSGRN